jgi:hypothetical protein
MENSNLTYLKVVQQTVKPSSGLAAACVRLEVRRYCFALGLIAPVDSPTLSHRPLRIVTLVRHLQVLDLRLPYEE